MTIQLIQDFEKKFKNNVKWNFNVGDTVRVHTKIIEGEKERVQVFAGIVVSIKGKSLSKTFTIYRNAYGCSMERVFLLNSPRITKVEVEKKGKVKRSKLYHLRGESGKRAKIKEQIFRKTKETNNVLETAPTKKIEEKPTQEVKEPKVIKKEIEITPKEKSKKNKEEVKKTKKTSKEKKKKDK